MSTATAVVSPTTTDRPLWIAPELWFRMSWSARMRAVRRAMHVVPTPKTNTGAGAEPSGETAAAPVPLTWREAARRNHIALAYMVTVGGNHVTHPVPGVDLRHRRKSRAYRPVTP